MSDHKLLASFAVRRQDKIARDFLSFVNKIVKLLFTYFVFMFVLDTLDFSIFPSHDTLAWDQLLS